jgi:hypothetical protein
MNPRTHAILFSAPAVANLSKKYFTANKKNPLSIDPLYLRDPNMCNRQYKKKPTLGSNIFSYFIARSGASSHSKIIASPLRAPAFAYNNSAVIRAKILSFSRSAYPICVGKIEFDLLAGVCQASLRNKARAK